MPESFKELLLLGGMPAEAARKLAVLPRPAVRFSTRRLKAGEVGPEGGSRLGGSPDLAPGFTWPRWNGQPLSFVGQINLADVAAYPFCSVLPAAGVLSFFYEHEQGAWGFDPKDRGSWLVQFEPDPTVLRRSPETDAPMAPYPAGALSVSEAQTLPAIDSQPVEDLALSPQELDVYCDVLERIGDQTPEAVQHQLLGHAAPVQGDMQLECQLVSNGVYCGDPSGYESARARELRPGASSWRLLMQIDSDDTIDMMWGDCGRIYFWITDDALQRRAFGEAWMVLQCS